MAELDELSVILATAREELKKTLESLAVQREKIKQGEDRISELEDRGKQIEQECKNKQDLLQKQAEDIEEKILLDHKGLRRDLEQKRQEVEAEIRRLEEQREKNGSLLVSELQERDKLKTEIEGLQNQSQGLQKEIKEYKQQKTSIDLLESIKNKLEADIVEIGKEKTAKTKSFEALSKDASFLEQRIMDMNQKLLILDEREANICFREKFHEEKKQNFIHIAKQLAAIYDKPEAMKYLSKFL